MKVLILGASGYLGSNIYNKLSFNSDIEVIGTCFNKASDKYVYVDVTKNDSIFEVYKNFIPDIVIWSVMNGPEEGLLIENGLKSLINVSKPETKVIYISTDGVFSDGIGNYSEKDVPTFFAIDTPLTNYSNAKLSGEKILEGNFDNYIIIRTGPIYGMDGNRQWDKRITNLISCNKENTFLKRATNIYRSFVHIDDISEGILELSQSSYKGIIHFGSSVKESYYSFSNKITKILKLDRVCLIDEEIDPVEAYKKGIPLDTSLNTSKASIVLRTKFRSLDDL